MKELDVRGRGGLFATWEPRRGGIMIRLDDDAAPEFWAEVFVPDAVVKAMARSQGLTDTAEQPHTPADRGERP